MEKRNRFISQSYNDALKDYEYSLNNPNSPHWDYVFITASNEQQADSYNQQIARRKSAGLLCPKTEFVVLPDINGERIGSGGATLNILKYLCETCGIEKMLDNKVLVLHSGGDSKRIPQYSAVGKLFSPVPRSISDERIITIFDELMIICSGIPNRVGYGLFTMCGDTTMVFNPLQIDLKSSDAAGISIKTSIQEGTSHGVFVANQDKVVTEFLHKQSEETLRNKNAVDSNGNVDVDTGTIWFSKEVCQALFSLIAPNGKIDDNLFKAYVNGNVCLSLYADFLPPLAAETTFEGYKAETPETSITPELIECRTNIWNVLNGFALDVVRMIPAEYIHFGTTWEMHRMVTKGIKKYEHLEWSQKVLTNYKGRNAAVFSSVIDEKAVLKDRCWVENSEIKGNSVINNGAIVSGVVLDNVEVPADTVLHGFKTLDGKYIVRIYGVNDNPKNHAGNEFLGKSLLTLIKNTGIDEEEIWDEEVPSIWNANIYPLCASMEEAVNSALSLYRIITGSADSEEIEKWKQASRLSLKSSFNQADVNWILDFQNELIKKVKVLNFIDKLQRDYPVDSALEEFGQIDDSMVDLLITNADRVGFPMDMKVYNALSRYAYLNKKTLCNQTYHQFEDKSYQILKDVICKETLSRFSFPKNAVITEDEAIIKMPVRVNFCGSPSDAAPYCIEYGGTMIDGTLLLKGDYPIVITAKKLKENKIVFGSDDLKAEKEYTDIKEIQACDNTDDTFALHKACLVAMGLIPEKDTTESIDDICKRIGGGISLSTSVDVPKGSGLGTSSIIAVGCIKAINSLFGIESDEESVYAQVFAAEQLMSTGGGWQDQVGGYDYGIKYFTSQPGAYQKITVERPNISEETFKELSERFCLIFSGQRRLAKNVLREEMNKCIGNRNGTLNLVEQIRELCAIMKYQLEKGDVTAFAKCISKQFNIIKKIDQGASNTCIEYIFEVCDDLIEGKSICGAGGGGFLQVVLKEGVTKKMLADRIDSEFADCGVQVWDCTLLGGQQ